MWKDPIVEKTRELRQKYADKFAHDVDAIFEDICMRQENSGRKVLSNPPRKAKSKKNTA